MQVNVEVVRRLAKTKGVKRSMMFNVYYLIKYTHMASIEKDE